MISPTSAKKIQKLELLKLEMLQIVTAAPEYLSISLPDPNLLPVDMRPINEASYFTASSYVGQIIADPIYRRLHFLPAVLLSEVYSCLLHS